MSDLRTKCLYCYDHLKDDETDYHPLCSKKFFGSTVPPVLDFGLKDIADLAIKNFRKKYCTYRGSAKTFT